MKPLFVDHDGAFEVSRIGHDVEVTLCYPRLHSIAAVQVALMDVRASDSVRIWYDFERNGWVVQQASTFEWDADDKVCDSDWQEVAFVQAWAREREQP